MKRIVFFGDSITDMNRTKGEDPARDMGVGYPNFIAGELGCSNPNTYEFVNRGISGNTTVDLYARIKTDVWNLSPDILSILIGVNDVWHGLDEANGVEIDRYERMYRMIIEDTKKRFPNVTLVMCEPFVLKGSATAGSEERWQQFCEVKEYAKVVKRLAAEYGAHFVPLQEKFDELATKDGTDNYLFDGVHPVAAGAKVIAEEWVKVFRNAVQ